VPSADGWEVFPHRARWATIAAIAAVMVVVAVVDAPEWAVIVCPLVVATIFGAYGLTRIVRHQRRPPTPSGP
jgi:hypothetical protein